MTDENGMKWPFPFSSTVWYMQTKIKNKEHSGLFIHNSKTNYCSEKKSNIILCEERKKVSV